MNGIYFAACLTKLAAGRIDRVLRYYTEVSYVPAGGATGLAGEITMRLTALKLGVGGAPPDAVSKSWTVGSTYTIDTSVASSGVYMGPLGTVIVPGAANPISGRDILIENMATNSRFGTGKFCPTRAQVHCIRHHALSKRRASSRRRGAHLAMSLQSTPVVRFRAAKAVAAARLRNPAGGCPVQRA